MPTLKVEQSKPGCPCWALGMEGYGSGRPTPGGDPEAWDPSMCPLSPLRTGSGSQDVHQGWGKSSAEERGPSPGSHVLAWQRSTGSFVIQLSFRIRALLLAISARQQQLSGRRLAAGVSRKLPWPLQERSGSPCRARGHASLVCLPSCLLQSASRQPSAPSHSPGFLCCVCLIQHSSSCCRRLPKTSLAGDDVCAMGPCLGASMRPL